MNEDIRLITGGLGEDYGEYDKKGIIRGNGY